MEENPQNQKHKFFKGKLSNKFRSVLVVILCVAIVLIFASTFKTTKTTTNVQTTNTFSSLEYCKQLENRLECVLSGVKDIGKVKAFVMVEGSPQVTYLQEKETTQNNGQTTSKETIYEARNGSTYYPVVVVEMLPKVVGVLIVASGAKDVKMKVSLTNIVASVLSVDISKVEVMEGK